VERTVETIHSLGDFIVRNDQGRGDEHEMTAADREGSVLEESLTEGQQLRTGLVDLSEIIALEILLDVEATKQAADAILFDAWVLRLQIVKALFQDLPFAQDLFEDLVLECILQSCIRGRHANGMSIVGASIPQGVCREMIGNVLSHTQTAEWDVGSIDALGERHHVRDNGGVGESKQAASAAKAGHDFIADQKNSVLVTQLSQTLKVARRGWEDAISASDRLDENRGNCVWAFEVELLAEGVQRLLADFLGIASLAPAERIRIGAEEMFHGAVHGLVWPATKIPSHTHTGLCGAVVGAVARENLLPARKQASSANGGLVGLSPGRREHELVDVSWTDVGKQASQLGAGGDQTGFSPYHRSVFHLFDDGVHDLLRHVVAKICADSLTGQIQDLSAAGGIEIRAFTSCNGGVRLKGGFRSGKRGADVITGSLPDLLICPIFRLCCPFQCEFRAVGEIEVGGCDVRNGQAI